MRAALFQGIGASRQLVILITLALVPLGACGGPANSDPGDSVRQRGEALSGTSGSINVALASNGGSAIASSTYPTSPTSGPYGPAMANDGSRVVTGGGVDSGYWRDNTDGTFPDYLEIDFSGSPIIDEIDVFSPQDGMATSAPTEATIGTTSVLRSFNVQYWTGSAWATVPGGAVSDNTLVWYKLIFAPLTTSRIRIEVTAAASAWSTIAEVEAWTSRTWYDDYGCGQDLCGPTSSCSSRDDTSARFNIHGAFMGCFATGSTCAQLNLCDAPPCSTYCTASSSCSSTNYCRNNEGTAVITCNDYNVCNRGTCQAFCGGYTLKLCTDTCTSGDGTTSTCGAQRFACVGAVNSPPPACSTCTIESACYQACLDASGRNSTCRAFACQSTNTDVKATMNATGVNGSLEVAYDPMNVIKGVDDDTFHVQGVQRLYYPAAFAYAFSASVDQFPDPNRNHVFFAGTDGQIAMGIQLNSAYNHPGGMQAFGRWLFVPLESTNDSGTGPAEVWVVDTSSTQPDNPYAKHMIVSRSSGGAAAVGATYVPSSGPSAWRNKMMMMVAGKDTEKVSLYVKSPNSSGLMDPSDPSTPWLGAGCWHRSSGGDANCPSIVKGSELANGDVSMGMYQGINLVTQRDGRIFMIAYYDDGGGNIIDVWRIVWPFETMPDGSTCTNASYFCLVKTNQRVVTSNQIDVETFKRGTGVYIDDAANRLTSYSTDKLPVGSASDNSMILKLNEYY